jgi:hypothetical protein
MSVTVTWDPTGKDRTDRYTKEEMEAIEWMNKRYYCTMLHSGGWAYFRVISEDCGRTTILTKARFIKSLVGERVISTDAYGNRKPIPLSKFWLESPLRRFVEHSELELKEAI